jgi:2Fe-2S ferredoxin
MVAITYVEHDGTEHAVDVDEQMSLMEGATLNMVPGVEGVCGGICSCATCHCYIPEEWQSKMPPVSDGENSMLENAIDRRANSRLGCQISVTPEFEGMRVELPEEQA